MSKEIEWLRYALGKTGNDEHKKAEKKINDFKSLLEEKGFSVMMDTFCDMPQFVVSKSIHRVSINIEALIKAPESHVLDFINRKMKDLISKTEI